MVRRSIDSERVLIRINKFLHVCNKELEGDLGQRPLVGRFQIISLNSNIAMALHQILSTSVHQGATGTFRHDWSKSCLLHHASQRAYLSI